MTFNKLPFFLRGYIVSPQNGGANVEDEFTVQFHRITKKKVAQSTTVIKAQRVTEKNGCGN